MKIAIIGAGAMGGAIAEGILKKNVMPAGDLIVSNPSEGKLQRFAEQGAVTTSDNCEAVRQADWIILAVKPWIVKDVLYEIQGALNPHQLLISVAAGSSDDLKLWTGEQMPLFVAIPNIAIAHGLSMTFVQPLRATSEQTDEVVAFFDKMGWSIAVDEQHLKAGMALSSCGIAYAFRYIRAASEGGVQLGFKADLAKNIVMQTLAGAINLLSAEHLHPEEAIDRVTTPGGITIRGLNAMEEAGFSNAVIQGLKASMK